MAVNRHSALRKCRNAVSAGVLSPISSAVGRNGAVGDKESARAGARTYPRRRQILRLRRCAATPHPSRLRRATCLPAGRSAGLTRHRRVIQYRGPQGEGLGDKKKRPGALLLALFISFWRCRSGRSGTGETGPRRGLRRGRRSWENPWHRRP